MKPVLVLDSSYRPIKQVSWQKAMLLYFQDKIEVIREYEDTWINSPNKKFKLPAVIRLVNYIFKLPWGIKLTRTNLYIRDHGCCQYCNKRLNKSRFTIDHIVPSSKGGKTDWNNLVVSCPKCNTKKGDSLLKDTNFTLAKKPCQPKNNFFMVIKDETPEAWLDFIYNPQKS
jgi:5-methylcytosine-specific restriction endonuclease McrA